MNLSELAHLHLLLNHFPTIGTIIGVGLFLVALITKNDDLKRAGLGIFLIIALLSIPVYMSGKAAQQAIADQPGVSAALIESHQDGAFLALAFMELTGAVAWLGLWQYRRMSRATSLNLSAVLILSIITLGLMARTANMAGEIRHPEIAPGATAGADTELLQTESIASYISTRDWAWPALESLHFVGLCLLLGAVLVVNLRMLGVMKSVSFAAVHRLLPWGILGFGINLVTGFLFFVTVPSQYIQNIALIWKTFLIMIGGMNVFYFTLFEQPWIVGAGEDAPLSGKVVAAATIFIWLGVIWLGRMMPFIGGSF